MFFRKFCFLAVMAVLGAVVTGCSLVIDVQYEKNGSDIGICLNSPLSQHPVYRDRGYLERALENLLIGSSHGGRLPPNIARVYGTGDKVIYRSGRLRPEFLPHLKNLGINSIISLRRPSKDVKEAIRRNAITWHPMPVSSTSLSVDFLEKAVDKVLAATGPVLVHCRAGADRTGMVIAALRVRQGRHEIRSLYHEMKNHLHVRFKKYLYYQDLLRELIRRDKDRLYQNIPVK